MLAAEGLVTGNDEALTTLQIGPFRVASIEYNAIVTDFVDGLVPAAAAGIATGTAVNSFIAGGLASATKVFLTVLKFGVAFGNDISSQQRWRVLIEIKRSNQEGLLPTTADIVDRLALAAAEPIDETTVIEATDWLQAAEPIHGQVPVALIVADDDRFRSLA